MSVHSNQYVTSSQRRARAEAPAAVDTRQARITTAEATAAAAALRAKVENGTAHPAGSQSPHRHRRVSPSPECRRERHGQCGSPAAVQTIIKDSSGSTPWPMLTKTNYNEWSLVMKVKM